MDEWIVGPRVRRQQLRNICNGRDAAFALAALTDEGCRGVLAEAETGRVLDRERRVVIRQGCQQRVAAAQAADRVRADADDALAGGLRVEEAVEADDAVDVGLGHAQAVRDGVDGLRADVTGVGLHVPEQRQQGLAPAPGVGGEEGVERRGSVSVTSLILQQIQLHSITVMESCQWSGCSAGNDVQARLALAPLDVCGAVQSIAASGKLAFKCS